MLKLIITYCSWGAIHIPGKPAREDSLCGKHCYLIYSAHANFHIGVEGNDVTHQWLCCFNCNHVFGTVQY